MQDNSACIICKKLIHGTYVSCTSCTFVRMCTLCHTTNRMHHEHGEIPIEQVKTKALVVTSISSSTLKEKEELTTAKPKYKIPKPKGVSMSRMMHSQNGRGSDDSS